MPLIDVVMTVRNGERFLPAALDSLAAQTLPDFRLLVCDDGSDDATAAILARETRFPVTLIRHDSSRGVAASLNELISMPSDSAYVARFDGDDICLPHRLESQARFLEKHPDIGIVGTWLEIIDQSGRTIGRHDYPTDPDGIRCELLFTNPLGHPSVMARSGYLRTGGPCYDPAFSHAEDHDLWCRLGASVRMANIPMPLVRYRRHAAAVGVAHRKTQISQMQTIRRRWTERLGLAPADTTLLLALLDLGPSAGLVTAGRATSLLKALDRAFSPTASPHVRLRRDELALALLRRLPTSARLAFLASDHAAARAYLAKKIGHATAGWRRWLRESADNFRRRRSARRIRGEIRRNGGTCPPDFRIYGDATYNNATKPRRILLSENIVMEHGCSFWLGSPAQGSGGRLSAGDHLFLGFNTRINIFADVTIGRQVSIGANSYIASNNHNYACRETPIQTQGFNGAPVIIGDDVWIGCNVVVLPGVSIGTGAVIGAGSVVTHDVPPFEVWAGVPARKIKPR